MYLTCVKSGGHLAIHIRSNNAQRSEWPLQSDWLIDREYLYLLSSKGF
jgi:hypothetical protein